MDRREFLASGAACAIVHPRRLAAQPAPAPAAPAFSFDSVVALAEQTARRPFVPTETELSGGFAKLNYDQFQSIRFRRDHDPWQGLPFGLDLMPPGLIYRERVEISLVADGVVQPLPFDPSALTHDAKLFPPDADLAARGEMGWSGFRLRTALNRPDAMDEFIVFQGASYFRVVSRGLTYGLSARGLALGTGDAGGEEFPVFRAFWLHRPGPADRSVRIDALLDSPSVAGAYAFEVTPGLETVVTTRAVLFPRRSLPRAGIAPLTSMFWFNPADRDLVDDYRSAVHDSDGLAMVTGRNERIWRVLSNPHHLQLSDFADAEPKGFALMQRAMTFEDFGDAEARYHTRPSAWIVPHQGFGHGAVGLVEIPVQSEFHDNIVAFWRPAAPLEPGTRHEFSYDMVFGTAVSDRAGLARVLRTRSGASINRKGARSFMVDFDDVPLEGRQPAIELRASSGKPGHRYVKRLPAEGVARLAFDFLPDNGKPADLVARLVDFTGAPLSETWVYRWSD